ncbi:MAG: hypothetical protein ACI9OI_002381, partial [Chitinophagales bacterium]
GVSWLCSVSGLNTVEFTFKNGTKLGNSSDELKKLYQILCSKFIKDNTIGRSRFNKLAIYLVIRGVLKFLSYSTFFAILVTAIQTCFAIKKTAIIESRFELDASKDSIT